jgi:hypothetical protein
MDANLCVKKGAGLASLLLILLIPVTFAGPPSEINFQGTLESPSGDPVTGAHEFQLLFFDAPVGGTTIAAATVVAEISDAGRFSIALPIESPVLDVNELWYELAVDTGDDGLDLDDVFPERVRIHSVPYALLARNSELLAGMPAEGYSTDEEREIALEGKAPFDHAHDDLYWSLYGNVRAVTEPGFLGTLNEAPLFLGTRSEPALRLQPSTGTTNIVGGFPGNFVTQGASGGTIGGGGTTGGENTVAADFGTIGGGSGNTAGGAYAAVPGGSENVAQGDYSLAAGRRAKANHAGCFVWGDSVDADVTSTANDQFVVRANGGASFFTGAGGLRLRANNTSPNLISGFSANDFTPGVVGAAIAGGGTNGAENRVTDNYGAIGGGKGNLVGDATGTNIDASHATVSGGRDNTARGMYAVVGGGWDNDASAFCATIGGGGRTSAGDPDTNNRVTDDFGTVGGGGNNRAGNSTGPTTDAMYATVSGGEENAASGEYATVSGGLRNSATGEYSVIGGGFWNRATEPSSTVGGGGTNYAVALGATISGGYNNYALGDDSTIGGGFNNHADAAYSTVGGGMGNYSAGYGATVPGGINTHAKEYGSFAAGTQARSEHRGSFVWADSQDAIIESSTGDQVTFRCQGGVRFLSGSGGANQQVAWAPGSSSWTFSSDRNLKEGFKRVDAKQILQKVEELPIAEWNFKGHELRHIGPTAQDFHATFGLGSSETMIDGGDLHGVALAAIQGLHEILREKGAKITRQEQTIRELQARNRDIEDRLNRLESRLASMAAEESGSTK